MAHRTLQDFTEEIIAVYKRYERTGTIPWTYTIAARDLSYQVGSLTKTVMQLEGVRHAEGKSDDELKEKIGDELADIFAEVLFIAHELGISLEDAWSQMVRSDERKIASRST
jgi:hypothetical protein